MCIPDKRLLGNINEARQGKILEQPLGISADHRASNLKQITRYFPSHNKYNK
jgi:hypothetical protein